MAIRQALENTFDLQPLRRSDRNIIRLAVFEMLRTETSPAVAIDEALELARRFSEE